MDERTKTINLPKLPDGWTQLTAAQVESVNTYMAEKQRRLSIGQSETAADMDFKLKCFLLFTGLKVLKSTAKTPEGEVVYLFRRKGLRHILEYIPMQAWQIQQWTDSRLKWLDHPLGLTTCPYTYIKIRGKKFKAPGWQMTDVTHLQYSTAQNLIAAYWTCLRNADQQMRSNGDKDSIAELMNTAETMKCRFLACLFTPESTEREVSSGTSVRRVRRKVHVYESKQVTDNEHLFRSRADRMFPVMHQFFQSVQHYYAGIFPDLYTSHKTTVGHRDQLVMEVEMMNAVMKYMGFTSYEAINGANAVHILGALNTMSKEAKEIKAMNDKIKNGR